MPVTKARPTDLNGRVLEAAMEVGGRLLGNWTSYIVPQDKFDAIYKKAKDTLGFDLDMPVMVAANLLPPVLAELGLKIDTVRWEGYLEGFFQRLLANRARISALSDSDQEKELRKLATEAAKDDSKKKSAEAPKGSIYSAIAALVKGKDPEQQARVLRMFVRDMIAIGAGDKIYKEIRHADIPVDALANLYVLSDEIAGDGVTAEQVQAQRRNLLKVLVTPDGVVERAITILEKVKHHLDGYTTSPAFIAMDRSVMEFSQRQAHVADLYSTAKDPRPLQQRVAEGRRARASRSWLSKLFK